MKKKSDTSDKKNTRKRQKAETKEQKKLDKKKAQMVERLYVEDVIPVNDFDEDLGVAIMEDGMILDMFQIITKDINSTSREELKLDQHLWDKLYKTYADDLKVVGFYFLPDTAEQQEYMSRLLYRTESPILRKLIKGKKEELAFVANTENYIEMQFFLLFYSKNKVEYRQNITTIFTLLNRGFLPLVETMTKEKKKAVLHKINNKNMEGGR